MHWRLFNEHQHSDKLKVEIMDHTALITIDNPGANTDTESLPALAALIDALNADKNIFALVITGQGEKIFSAGADLNLFADGDPNNARQMAEFFGKGFECLADFAASPLRDQWLRHGWRTGGLPRLRHSNRRNSGPDGATRTQGRSAALRRRHPAPVVVSRRGMGQKMILCGERVNAETAERIGLVEEVVATGEAQERARTGCPSCPAKPHFGDHCKELIHQARDNASDALPYEREKFVDLFRTEDQREGVNAFLEKRPPV